MTWNRLCKADECDETDMRSQEWCSATTSGYLVKFRFGKALYLQASGVLTSKNMKLESASRLIEENEEV